MKLKKLYQVFDTATNSERFCFNAKSDDEALDKLSGWLRYQGLLSIKKQFCLNQVIAPKYPNNIHNEWV